MPQLAADLLTLCTAGTGSGGQGYGGGYDSQSGQVWLQGSSQYMSRPHPACCSWQLTCWRFVLQAGPVARATVARAESTLSQVR